MNIISSSKNVSKNDFHPAGIVNVLQPFSGGVRLYEPGHKYFDEKGREFESMSSFLGKFKNKFDTEMMSKASGGKMLRESGMKYYSKELMQIAADKKKKDWKQISDYSSSQGTNFHNAAESHAKGEAIESSQEENVEMMKQVLSFHTDAKRLYPEAVIASFKHGICGTSDKIFEVGKSKGKRIVDITDYKTNIRRGIETYSRYKLKMLPPLSHFEDCNFYHYGLQVSGYAYILETEYDCIIRRLILYYVDLKNKAVVPYHIPYLKSDFEKLLSV